MNGPTLEACGGLVVGVDGCRAGWLAIAIDAGGATSWGVFASFDQVPAHWPRVERLLIDMPIGLADDAPRAVEREARQRLGRPRASSVFAVPCRAAVYAPDYVSACARNRERLGCAISKQAWHLTPKIRELDRWLAGAPAWREQVLEAHPELCFAALTPSGQAMEAGKKTVAGQAARLELLAAHFAAARRLHEEIVEATRRADVARDDVTDALVLAMSARGPLARIPATDQACAHMVFPKRA
ncbi:MAG: DUF429 domain-containing protein [Pseudomonadota bacterium]